MVNIPYSGHIYYIRQITVILVSVVTVINWRLLWILIGMITRL